jgi:hypothetical protein
MQMKKLILLAAIPALVLCGVFGLSSPANAAAEKTLTSTGVVQSYTASEHAFTVKTDAGELKFVWTKETKFNGVVGNGARVTVRYTPQAGGDNVAQTVGVLR